MAGCPYHHHLRAAHEEAARRRRLGLCAFCGEPLPTRRGDHVRECEGCFEWLNSTCDEDEPADYSEPFGDPEPTL